MDLAEHAKEIRKTIIELAHSSKIPHVGSAFSCTDILTVLYFKKMRLDPWENRDVFILSKGHCEAALYSTLFHKGILDEQTLAGYCKNDGALPSHLDRFSARGIEVSTGALGHGFNMGLGMAYGFKKKHEDRSVYAVIGDGESQEGSIWEGALFAPKLGLDNFTVVLDYNNLQGYGRARDLCEYEPVQKKWDAFGWTTYSIDGHDLGQIEEALNAPHHGRPKIIIACTTKGKGVSFMEDKLIWHYYIVTDEIREKALKELG
ncbi:MAG: transketolase [Candidatus Omnitrophota bacterium]